MSCCEPEGGPSGAEARVQGVSHAPGHAEVQQKFLDFLHAASAPGVLDARTKRAIAIALSVLARCQPCLKTHLGKAREEGFSQEEIDEAAWMGIAFGGSPAMTFYNGLRRP